VSNIYILLFTNLERSKAYKGVSAKQGTLLPI